MEAATYYLVIKTVAATLAPFPIVSPLIGPITKTDCENAKIAMTTLPETVSASCKRAIGLRMVTSPDGSSGYPYPVFEGEMPTSGQ